MLTNLSWLAPGQVYPPASEQKRIDQYTLNEQLFCSEHNEAWKSSFDRLAFICRKRNADVLTIFNYHQLLSKKTADFVCSEPPTLELGRGADELEALLDQQHFYAKLYESVIDISRFGNGVVKIVDKRCTVISPRHWFPVVAPNDLKSVTQHVIAYPVAPDAKGKPTQLYVEIHTPSRVETRYYSFNPTSGDKGMIGDPIQSTGSPTGLPGFAVFPLSNITHSGSIYGLDDYAIINTLVEKIMWRLHCADTIMDKHSEPSVTGPSSALTLDERTGLYLFKAGNYFSRDTREDPDVSYITWDGNLDSNFKELELLFDQLYILSEMGAAFTEGSGEGAASSGTALKLRLVSPRIKAKRLVGINDSTVRDIIATLGRVNGISLDPNMLSLEWHDGLPDDPVEDANRRNVETGGRPTKSQFSAIKERGLSDAETEAELEQIRLETAANSANILGVTDQLEDEPEEETDGIAE